MMTNFFKLFEKEPRFCNGTSEGGIHAGVMAVLVLNLDKSGAAIASPPDFLFFGFFLITVGLLTFMAIFLRGGISWILYVFLIPFWAAFPMASLGVKTGAVIMAIYLVGFPSIKLWLTSTQKGKALAKQWAVGSLAGEGKFFGGGASRKW
jgi:uncharacterized protein